MHIVYLLIHKVRLEENNPPYYYIGSKRNWKGQGTYYSSSRRDFMKTAYPEDLVLTPIWTSEDCSLTELHEKEKEFQIKHDVIKNPLFFNGNIANSYMYDITPESLEKRIKSFLEVANQVDENGVKNSLKWSMKARESLNSPEKKLEISENSRKRMLSPSKENPNKLLKDLVWERMMETSLRVGDDGLNSFQRGGLKIKETLAKELPSGIKLSEQRVYYGNDRCRFELFDICFFNRQQAAKLFGVEADTIDRLREGWCSTTTYNKVCEVLGSDYLHRFKIRIKNPGSDYSVVVCGETFESLADFKRKLKAPHTATDRFSVDGIISKKLKIRMIEYFGEEVYYSFYPN